MSTELFAVNAVTDRIAACPRLSPAIMTGDKVPITDGHIDFYDTETKENTSHAGRVPVQVKGRVTNAKTKASRDTRSFSVEREVLAFFRNHGGGIYFYVPMKEGGQQREVFYSILLPFKIVRLLRGKPSTQKTFSIKMTKLPEEHAKVEQIVRLAWHGRTQGSTPGGLDHLLAQAESFTIHSLAGITEDRPTRLALDETDYVVVAHLTDGLDIPIDIDLDVLPAQYVERPLAVSVSCGGIEFDSGTGRRIEDDTFLFQLSAGLEVRLRSSNESIDSNLSLTLDGSLVEQAKNLDFMIAAAAGQPLIIGDKINEPLAGDAGLESELRGIRHDMGRLIELFTELGIDDAFSSDLEIDPRTKRMLLALHEGLLLDKPVQADSDGTGRFDIPIGEHKIMVIVLPAEDSGWRRIVDPFDPTKRDRFQIYHANEDGTVAQVDWGTVYEAVTPEDLSTVLNLRLGNLVAAYEELEDRIDASTKANYMALRLLSAADIAKDQSHREQLLQGASELCDWLLQVEPDSLVFRINRWQILYRLGDLGDSDRRGIRAARRALDRQDDQFSLLEVCMLVLLNDSEELQYAVSELTKEEAEKLQAWPIWSLSKLSNTVETSVP